jgi:hypothetical protein
MVHGNDPQQSFEIPTNMRRLQLLRAEGNRVESIYMVAQSPQLVWLCWYSCSFSSLPSWISLKNLRVLYIQGENLETLWQHESQVVMFFLDRNVILCFSSNCKNCLLLSIVLVYQNAKRLTWRGETHFENVNIAGTSAVEGIKY